MRTKLFAVLVIGLLLAADDPKKTGQDQLTKLRGTWAVTAMEFGGQKAPPDFVKDFNLIIEGDKLTFSASGNKREGTIRIDPTKKPATLDFIPSEGVQKGMVEMGIYSLEGDTLKLALNQGDTRPTAFVTKKNTRTTVYVLKRSKK